MKISLFIIVITGLVLTACSGSEEVEVTPQMDVVDPVSTVEVESETTANQSWVAVNNCELPEDLVEGGIENNNVLHICRGEYLGEYHAGKIIDCKCNVGFVEQELPLETFDALTGNKNLEWIHISDCSVPSNALKVETNNSSSFAICRANHNGSVHPGKVVNCGCAFGYGGLEIISEDYDILTSISVQ